MYNTGKHFLKRVPLFLILLPVFFIYSGYNELFGFLEQAFVIRNFLFLLVLTGLLFLLGRLLFQQNRKAVLFTFFLLCYSLLFGFLHDSLKRINPKGLLQSYTFLLPVSVLLIGLLAVWLKRTSAAFTELYTYLNLLLLALLLSEVPNSIRRYRLDKSAQNLIDFRFNAYRQFQSTATQPDSTKPDIYFIVFDAMASSKSIKSSLGRNNDSLDSLLTQNGFYVVHNSNANYNWTIHSISTTFNMDYLPEYILPVMNDPKVYFWGGASILDNSLTAILKKEGYEFRQFQPVSFNNKDWPLPTYFSDLKEQHYFFKTLPGRVYKDIFWNFKKVTNNFIEKKQEKLVLDRNQKRKTEIDTTLALLERSTQATTVPKFVYGHFMIPHDPYSFDRNGAIVSASSGMILSPSEEAAAYWEQVQYANKLIKQVTEIIKKSPKRNTIIIIEGDHGYKYYKDKFSTYTFQNLNAIYFPDKDYSLLYDSISPVNTFRVVLNKYFKAGFPLLKDTSIFVTQKKEMINSAMQLPPTGIPLSPNH
jgi:hypothetical protein